MIKRENLTVEETVEALEEKMEEMEVRVTNAVSEIKDDLKAIKKLLENQFRFKDVLLESLLKAEKEGN